MTRARHDVAMGGVTAGRTWHNHPLSLLGTVVVPAETEGCAGLSHRLAGLVSPESCHRSVTLAGRFWGHLPVVTQGSQVGSPALQPLGPRQPWLQAQGMGWGCQKSWHGSPAGSHLPYRR